MSTSLNILVFNCGSSSLKFRLLAFPGERELARGEAQRIGPKTAEPARMVAVIDGDAREYPADMPDHAAALAETMRLLGETPTLMPHALGHRTVHGGSRFCEHTLLNDAAIADLEKTKALAPIHMPPILRVIQACREHYPRLPQVAVFDTAYHRTIPAHARVYALSSRVRDRLGVSKIGFHGISHEYVAGEAARLLGKPLGGLRAVSCHLGSGGASFCAIINGASVDSTMGYSPLAGLVMSTRSGDLDPDAMLRLLVHHRNDARASEDLLNKRSGVLGISGVSADIRDVLKLSRGEGPQAERCRWAFNLYSWRLRRYLGAFLATVAPADAIIFTDTIGETVPEVRAAACEGLGLFGVKIDPERNAKADASKQGMPLPIDVATIESRVRVLAVATNEELAIARCTFEALREANALPAGGAA